MDHCGRPNLESRPIGAATSTLAWISFLSTFCVSNRVFEIGADEDVLFILARTVFATQLALLVGTRASFMSIDAGIVYQIN